MILVEKIEYSYEVPDCYTKKEAEKKGRLTTVTYHTKAYGGDNRALIKSAVVYLPYEYDVSKQYNILYLMHGGGGTETSWLAEEPENVNMIDNLIARGIVQPLIIVTPTFYHRDGSDTMINTNLTENFQHELRNDLIPAVESKFMTFAKGDTSEEVLIATRDYRAFAGLSMGSMTTYWSALCGCLDLFSWFGPYSGCCGPTADQDAAAKRILAAIESEGFKDYSINYLFACNGTDDIAYKEHVVVMEKVLASTNKLKENVNYDFMVIPEGRHDMRAWQLDLYHTLQKFFK
jgi:enterochelin esterase-like enzyme